MDRSILRDIHRYWFGDLKRHDDLPEEKLKLWFERSEATDTHIRETWGARIPEAARIAWEPASLAREEAAGLIVLLDQFPRNIFRTSGEAFACDAKAREIASALIAGGLDRFFTAEQVAIILPLEHSEDVADQDRCTMLYADSAVRASPEWLKSARSQLDYATKHRDLIRKFGRFPHRNEVLGRPSTPEELAFLKGGRGY